MVRLGIYEDRSNNIKKSVENKDSKPSSFAFDFYTDTPIVSPYSLDAISDKKPNNAGAITGNGDVESTKVTDEERTESKGDSKPEDLTQIWWDFLGETSLHGCKNVRERQVIKRVVWGCFILAMATLLCWALLSLLLRYQEHPFVSVWGFQREIKVSPPGVTFCIPAKFHKGKLASASPAYQLLAFADDDDFSLFGGSQLKLDLGGYEKYFESWREELETISLRRSQYEIGFTKKDLFWYSKLFMGNREYELMSIIEDIDGDGQTCWAVNWYQLNVSKPERDNRDENYEEYLSDDEDNDVYSMYGSHNNSNNNRSESQDGYSSEKGDRGNTKDKSTSADHFKPQSTLASILSEQYLSSTTFHPKRRGFSDTTTPPSESGRDSDKKEESEIKGGNPMVYDSNLAASLMVDKTTGDVHLSQDDSAVFMINLQQDQWLSAVHYAGLQVYLHDPASPYWNEKPLLLRPGTVSNIYYKTTKYKFLPLPYKSFSGIEPGGPGRSSRYTGCVDTSSPSFESRMVSLPKALYSSEMCMLETTMNRSTQICRCSLEGFYNQLHGTSPCSIYQYITCFSKALEEEYSKLQWQLAEGEDDEELPCPQACKMTRYERTVSTADFPTLQSRDEMMKEMEMSLEEIRANVLLVDLKPESPLTVTVEHVPELTILSIVGSAGGVDGAVSGR